MPDKTRARLGIVGYGSMGSNHAHSMAQLENVDFVAASDVIPANLEQAKRDYGVATYSDFREMLAKEDLDGILIATPHYDHVPVSIAAFEAGVSVLTEKPLAADIADARKMIAAYEAAKASNPDLLFAAMFQQRTYGHWRKIKELIDEGALGKLIRATYIITNWFRTQAYFDSGGWRATWSGEGGGVLLNQCPHNIDIYQWLVGMPNRVTGFTSLGKYHNIEVEDEVTAYMEFDNGMIGHLITSTGEAPGSDRLEIVGENGKLIFENGKLTFFRTKESVLDLIDNSPERFLHVEHSIEDVPYPEPTTGNHIAIIENFADVILNGGDVTVPAVEGAGSLELANAILLSSFDHRTVDLPLDGEAYQRKLQELINTSSFVKPEVKSADDDMSKSFQ
ncbi:MAG: Gfo/Idh/MocA family oxidoreductase [Anaerolineae bacterium]|nr:Gfo/Idh/MocA family oxidoreductase [Anaerolineae bacterium]